MTFSPSPGIDSSVYIRPVKETRREVQERLNDILEPTGNISFED